KLAAGVSPRGWSGCCARISVRGNRSSFAADWKTSSAPFIRSFTRNPQSCTHVGGPSNPQRPDHDAHRITYSITYIGRFTFTDRRVRPGGRSGGYHAGPGIEGGSRCRG